jgi:hypothetical protein
MIVKRMAYCFSIVLLCSTFTLGCDKKEQKPEKKVETAQEKIGKEAAQDSKQPIDEAVKMRNQVEEKQKKKLEGC